MTQPGCPIGLPGQHIGAQLTLTLVRQGDCEPAGRGQPRRLPEPRPADEWVQLDPNHGCGPSGGAYPWLAGHITQPVAGIASAEPRRRAVPRGAAGSPQCRYGGPVLVLKMTMTPSLSMKTKMVALVATLTG